MKTKHIVTIIGVPIGFFVLFFPIAYYLGPGAPTTETIDIQLFETRILDWINTERGKNHVSGINLDAVLDDVTAQQVKIIANADPETIQELSNQNDTQVVNSYGYECVKEDGSIGQIGGIVLRSVHTKFLNVEFITDGYMEQLVENDEMRDMLFDPNLEKIGIGIAISDENIFALHYLC